MRNVSKVNINKLKEVEIVTDATDIPAIAPTLSFLLEPLPVDVIVLARVVENAAVVVDAAVAASVVVAPRVVETNVDIVAVSRGEYIMIRIIRPECMQSNHTLRRSGACCS